VSTTVGIVERVSDELARRIPKQQRTSVVHGDYRMDNVVLADDGTRPGHPSTGGDLQRWAIRWPTSGC